jgi:hypothetical protein
MMQWQYRNLQFRTVPTIGVWSRISQRDLERLEGLQNEGWEVFHSVDIKGSLGFTAHVLFMLRRQVPE